jgi:hypothetical protein
MDGPASATRTRGFRAPREPGRVEVPDAVTGRPGLTPRMAEATRALAEALFSNAHGPPPSGRIDWLVSEVDDYLRQAGPRARLAYRLCLLAVSTLAPLTELWPPPLRRLSIERRIEALERFERSPLGLAVFGAKAVLCIHYYEHPDAARAIGHDGACLTPRDEAS